MVGGSEAAVSGESQFWRKPVQLSERVYRQLQAIQEARETELGRQVTFTEVIEQLLAYREGQLLARQEGAKP